MIFKEMKQFLEGCAVWGPDTMLYIDISFYKFDMRFYAKLRYLHYLGKSTSDVSIELDVVDQYKILVESTDKIIEFLQFKIDIRKYFEEKIKPLILKEHQIRGKLKMSNCTLKGFDYRKHVFETMILPKYVNYLEVEMDKYFGYRGAHKRMAMIIKLDDLLFANINTLTKNKMNFVILLAMDSMENLEELAPVKYNEYMEVFDDSDEIIDESHYVFKFVIFPNINVSNEYFNFNKAKYLPSVDQVGEEKYNELVEKVSKFSDYVQYTMLPEFCKMWSQDIDTYIIDGMDESNFNDDN